MANNITYILGAGASCYSQPLVCNMKERMLSLLELLNQESKLHQEYFTFKLQGKTQVLYDKYEPILKEAVKHYTPDTFARKLHLTREKAKLTVLKEFLNLYFLFEQDIIKDAYSLFPEDPYKIAPKVYVLSSNQPYEKYTSSLVDEGRVKQIWKDISIPIDYRYDVFYATLLQALSDDNLSLPPNVNIFSWNYDNQLEMAYNEYENLNLVDIDSQLNINPNTYNQNKSHIIKLNGSCNRIYKDEENKVNNLTFLKALELLVENKSIHNKLYFAWETIGIDRKWGVAKQIIIETNILVIIGYSFPNFNWEVDKEMLNKLSQNNIKFVIIQVPFKEEFEKIKGRMMQLNSILSEKHFKHDVNPDQFYIPML